MPPFQQQFFLAQRTWHLKEYPYFPFYIAEVLLDTFGMNDQEFRSYINNLIKSWKNLDREKMPEWLAECLDENMKKSRILSENSKKRWELRSSNILENSENSIVENPNAMQLHNKSNANDIHKRRKEKKREEKIGEDISINNSKELLPTLISFFNSVYPDFAFNPRSKSSINEMERKLSARINSIPNFIDLLKDESKNKLDDFVHSGKWFGLKWILHSDSNAEKYLAGNYRAKQQKSNYQLMMEQQERLFGVKDNGIKTALIG